MSRQAAINKARREAKTSFTGKHYLNIDLLEDQYKMTPYKPGEGWNMFQIIPPRDPDVMFNKEVWLHWGVGINNSVILCPNKMKNDPCPICEHHARMLKSGVDPEDAYAFQAGKRFLYFLVDTSSDEEYEKSPKYYAMPKGNNIEVMELSQHEDTGEDLDISDPKAGFEIKFKRQGTGRNNTKYKRFQLVEGSPLDETFIDDVPEFDDALVYYSYDEIQAELATTVSLESEGSQSPGQRRPRAARADRGSNDSGEQTRTRTRSRDDRAASGKQNESDDKAQADDDDDAEDEKASTRSRSSRLSGRSDVGATSRSSRGRGSDDDDDNVAESDKPEDTARSSRARNRDRSDAPATTRDSLRDKLKSRLDGGGNDD